MAVQWAFRQRHPRWGVALSVATTTSLVAALFFAAATTTAPASPSPGAALSLTTPLPPPPGQPVFVVYRGAPRVDTGAAGAMQATLLSGTVLPTPADARMIAEEDCHVDAAGVEHCIHLLLLPDGSVLTVHHDHVPAAACPEVGDAVTVERAGSG